MSWRDIARNAMRPGFLPVMADKIAVRIQDRPHAARIGEARSWCARVAEDRESFARGLDADLWTEAVAFGEELRVTGARRVAEHGLTMGGGGDYTLLYFLVRLRRPPVVVETGVAAGFSSQALLAGLARNDAGQLYSSDFPYFRHPDPERTIGCVVDQDLRHRWELYLEGDARNLARIVGRTPAIDLFHYDSDKSYIGRARSLKLVGPAMAPGGLIVMDDIQDNLFFHDLAHARGATFHVFEFEGKYLGLLPLGGPSGESVGGVVA